MRIVNLKFYLIKQTKSHKKWKRVEIKLYIYKIKKKAMTHLVQDEMDCYNVYKKNKLNVIRYKIKFF